MDKAPVILGIDPGSYIVGWCVLRPGTAVTGFAAPADSMERPYRLLAVFSEIRNTVDIQKPNRIGIETPWVPQESKTKKRRGSVLSALKVAGVRDVCLVACVASGAPLSIEEIAPSTAKKALTGHGHAKKELMLDAAKEQLGDKTLIQDEADAFGIALATWDRIVGVRWPATRI